MIFYAVRTRSLFSSFCEVKNLDYIVSAATDTGLKKINQDSFGVKVADTVAGKAVIAVLCDGMGGLSHGEVASATVVDTFNKWFLYRMPILSEKKITEDIVYEEWLDIVSDCNRRVLLYGKNNGIRIGTTLTVLMIIDGRCFIMNIGDSRAYKISDSATVLTKDHTVTARELENGLITEEQAEIDPRRHILFKCIGMSGDINPDMFVQEVKEDTVYMLCSDGFRQRITEEEIFSLLKPSEMTEKSQMRLNMEKLIELNKARNEGDNMTAVAIKTFKNCESEAESCVSDGFAVREEFCFTSSLFLAEELPDGRCL